WPPSPARMLNQKSRSKGIPFRFITVEKRSNVEPRSFLIVGNLNEFESEFGPNQDKVRSFELYRRNVHKPEIFTFDELLFRAKFIVDSGETSQVARINSSEEDVPF
ncbi:MAG: DUF4263 domain-containing protein, partial [Sphingomonadales bacterium]|nr:DUF4263 domain-containing protein [Sphingomonadales bacterium]NCQ10196.1 DUF4263 domain-containing protein [Sphingomonadales bacterium]